MPYDDSDDNDLDDDDDDDSGQSEVLAWSPHLFQPACLAWLQKEGGRDDSDYEDLMMMMIMKIVMMLMVSHQDKMS